MATQESSCLREVTMQHMETPTTENKNPNQKEIQEPGTTCLNYTGTCFSFSLSRLASAPARCFRTHVLTFSRATEAKRCPPEVIPLASSPQTPQSPSISFLPRWQASQHNSAQFLVSYIIPLGPTPYFVPLKNHGYSDYDERDVIISLVSNQLWHQLWGRTQLRRSLSL